MLDVTHSLVAFSKRANASCGVKRSDHLNRATLIIFLHAKVTVCTLYCSKLQGTYICDTGDLAVPMQAASDSAACKVTGARVQQFADVVDG
jgi:hypothetical protein